MSKDADTALGGLIPRRHGRRAVQYLLAFFGSVLVLNALVGDNGYLAALRTKRDYAAAVDKYQKVNLENDMLSEQIRRMQEDPSALEEAARRDLNLIKPGETLVIIKDARPATPPPAPPAGK